MNTELSIYDAETDVQDEVRKLQKIMVKIKAAPKKTVAAKQHCAAAGCSWQKLHKRFIEWNRSGGTDLFTLVDRRFWPQLWANNQEIALPNEFLEWVGGKMLGNQRKSRPAYRLICEQVEKWRRTGAEKYRIPGYAEAPPPGMKGHPDGWSYKNLMRTAQPPKEELAIARIGTVAAKEFLPFVPGTREGVRFLEYVFWDDVVHDRKCILRGFVEPMRLLQLGGLDYGTGVYLKHGLRPDVPREDGTRERLKRRDFLWLIAEFHREFGYPADYPMHHIVERATATMSKAEAEFLFDISGGMIRVCYTSMEGQLVLAWQEAKSGNPQGKSPIESWHGLFHNEQAALAGQVGKDRDHSPAALYGSDREVVALNKAALLLTPRQKARLKLPYPELLEAHAQTMQIIHRINRRRDHVCEGFQKVLLWRLKKTKMEWRHEAELAQLDIPHNQIDFRPVQEMPIERLQKLSQGVTMNYIHPGALVRFYEDSHSPDTIKRRQAKVTIDGKRFIFGPERPGDCPPNGQRIVLHHAPIEPKIALVTLNGRFLGVWRRQLAHRGNAEELAQQISRKQSFLHAAVASVRGKMLDKLVEADRRLTDNQELLEDAGVLPSEADHSLAVRNQAPGTAVAGAMQGRTEQLDQEKRLERHTRATPKAPMSAFLAEDGSDPYDETPASPTQIASMEDFV
ncbi:MAG TPA: hypothetical protein VNP98_17285 [Chthoniobacterales bacterium]|nr:hypothetical protein [Chthoniobacterales bacterium]